MVFDFPFDRKAPVFMPVYGISKNQKNPGKLYDGN